ncbi:MAG: DMT family transporter [Ktedonobacteraceae bacterium]
MATDELTASDVYNIEADKHLAQPPLRQHRLYHDLLLVLVTIIWGSTFLLVKNTVKLSGPFTFVAICYGFGTLTLALIFRKRLLLITRAELISGMFIGVFLFTGYACQTIGLQYTPVSKAGFITGMSVPLVPIFSFFFLRQKPALAAIMGITLSIIGLTLISIDNEFNFVFGSGEVLILCCAVAFALHIVCISKFAPNANATNLAIVQLALTSLLSLIFMPIAHEAFISPPLIVWGAGLFMGIADIAFCLLMMNWVQQFISSTRASLLYSLEPMWAALFGYFLAGEVLSIPAWFGCGCILLGMIIGVLRFSHRKA